MKDQIIKAIAQTASIEENNIHLETPENEEYGDYSSNISLQIFSQFPTSKAGQASLISNFQFPIKNIKNPRMLAEKIVEKLKADKDLSEIVEKVEVAGPGFINFWLSKAVLIKDMEKAVHEVKRYGSSSTGEGKTAIVEYSSPNIARQFSVGHLRSTIIGQAIYNHYKFLGYKVIGENHLGDWGTQFGMIIAQIVKKDLDPQKLSVQEFQKLYVEFNKEAEGNPSIREEAKVWFKKLEEGDSKARKVWKSAVEISLEEFKRIYDLLNVKIDNAHGESFYEDKMPSVIDEIKEKGMAKESQGALIVELPNMPPLILLKSDGATTYQTRDLAALKYRIQTWDPKIIVYEVGAEQKLHFKQIFKVAELLGWKNDREFVHIGHGLVLIGGKKMGVRKGTDIKLEEVLQESVQRAKKIIEKSGTDRGLSEFDKEEVAKAVGIGAIKYWDLSHHPTSDIEFDWEKMFILEGNSGPYLQYTFARCQSVLKRAKIPISNNSASSPSRAESRDFQFPNNLTIKQFNNEELSLLRTFIHFPEVIEHSARNYAPNLLCNYLYNLAQKFNVFYNKHWILPRVDKKSKALKYEDPSSMIIRPYLTSATSQILKTGLGLLGIQSPEKM